MSKVLKWLNLSLRWLMEAGIVAGLGYWGYEVGGSTVGKTLLAISVPVVGFGFWGFVDFRNMGRVSEPLRLLQELVISGLAAIALYSVGQHFFGWALGLISVIYHILVYALGGTLLKN